MYSAEGTFTFTSHTPGEHVICLYSNSTKWFAGSLLVSSGGTGRLYGPVCSAGLNGYVLVSVWMTDFVGLKLCVFHPA